ncbi:MAG: glycogen/starch/alpha-glucan phosphorylase [Firmicutes bacterium]|nr:glycogen/starch/alpha-glucan phosphorylase [Bacillota bacterium]
MFESKQQFIDKYMSYCLQEIGRPFERCSDREKFYVLADMISDQAREIESAHGKQPEKKKVFYFSMEFLIGRLLDDYLSNLGIRDMVEDALKDLGADLETLELQEREPGLGNGGLGRLAACFLDSMAATGVAGYGNGIRYKYGLFKQKIEDGRQKELADNWLENDYPWEVRKDDSTVFVRFGGEVKRHEEDGRFWFTWEGGELVRAVPYDVPIVGHNGNRVSNLRLWSTEPYKDDFDIEAFDRGEYSEAVRYRADAEAISYMLYPNDSNINGKKLRLKQEYLFVAAGLSTILRSYYDYYGDDWEKFPTRVAIHTNDTHPALCAPELMRMLMDDYDVDWDSAWDIVTKTVSFTNHTILSEALECWPIDIMREMIPRTYMIIEEIDRRFKESVPMDIENRHRVIANTAILWDGTVHMANLSIIASYSVNGVAALHSEILKNIVFNDFYKLMPEKFNNKTNGVSHRRFLAESNRPLENLINTAIGKEWIGDASKLSELYRMENDHSFLHALESAKRANKERLAYFLKVGCMTNVIPDGVFDIQVKRFHAYKRQLLNVFKIIDYYFRLLDGTAPDLPPCNFIFAGKAAQGYKFAKDTIYLINRVAEKINNDSRVAGKMKVVFVENFSVGTGQLIYPAADISEQISTAGMEASGTGNMKFMMNGAITLGTLDGANVEILEKVGEENITIFGLKAEEVEELRRTGGYQAFAYCNANPRIKRVVDSLTDGTFSDKSDDFAGIRDELVFSNDYFFVLRDMPAYIEAWEKTMNIYADREKWNRISLRNIAASGFFSSDRTIKEYADEIWGC